MNSTKLRRSTSPAPRPARTSSHPRYLGISSAVQRNAQQKADGEVTRLIGRWRGGDWEAREKLFFAVYDDLRRVAAGYMRDERASHTLAPTALVHEAFLRMEKEESAVGIAENRRHFFSIAARAMRRILVEHARYLAALRRPSSRDAFPLDDIVLGTGDEMKVLEVIAVDEAMDRLRATNARQAEVVELRFFAGLEESEVADILSMSRATVTRDWRVAKMLLKSFFEAGQNGVEATKLARSL